MHVVSVFGSTATLRNNPDFPGIIWKSSHNFACVEFFGKRQLLITDEDMESWVKIRDILRFLSFPEKSAYAILIFSGFLVKINTGIIWF